MMLALHDPADGYYATRDPFGRAGDFITAPEVSQMFGELIGLWLVQCWRDQGSQAPARLVELGPGRGTLMADALRAAKLAPDFLAAIDVVLVEASPTLRAIQADKLKDCGASLRWLDRLDDSLADRPLFLIANEFFDALPVRQYVKTERGWCERMVSLDDAGNLVFALAPVAAAGLAVPEARGEAEPGAVYEVSPAATAFAEEIASLVTRQGGAALIMDYGHSGTGFGDTLQAVRSHKYAPVLETPGAADLSAHVDFAALAEAVRRGGAVAHGPLAQGAFLERLGLKPRAAALSKAHPEDQAPLSFAVERLTDPGQMGRLFQALAILPERAGTPPGF
ncbi:MAG: SAM-dependent methyltransferase [Pseudomonadota bacterium]|nr:SAM-dependent methyltransferase [Pseudomonadota bacterium]